jgi:Ca-activated chloride channel family protein
MTGDGRIWLDEFAARLTPGLLAAGIAAVGVLLALWVYAHRARCRDLARWSTTVRPRRRRFEYWTWLAAVVLLTLAAMGPPGSPAMVAPTRQGRDLLVVLDVSRSMDAEDRPPHSRLQRAKAALRDLLRGLERTAPGTRFGLILFAGQARLVCPLTEDWGYAAECVAQAGLDRLRPEERFTPADPGPAVGTSYRAAFRLAAAVAAREQPEFVDGLLITDGDDLAGDGPASVAAARQMGLTVHVFGLGDPERRVPIPTGRPEAPVLAADDADGDVVRTRRDDAVLAALARAGGGDLVLEGSTARPLAQWWQTSIAPRPQRVWERPRRLRYQEFPEPWIAAAGLLLLAEFCMRTPARTLREAAP